MDFINFDRKTPLKTVDVGDFWTRIKFLLKTRKLAGTNLAYKIGVKKDVFKSWSYRKIYPDFKYIYYMAQVLDTSVEFLTLGVDNNMAENGNYKIGEVVLLLARTLKHELYDS
jgi:ribosome-binding protein aMBF1 (putative translation factor)